MTTAYTMTQNSIFARQRMERKLRYIGEALRGFAELLRYEEKAAQSFTGIDQTDYVNYLYQNVWE